MKLEELFAKLETEAKEKRQQEQAQREKLTNQRSFFANNYQKVFREVVGQEIGRLKHKISVKGFDVIENQANKTIRFGPDILHIFFSVQTSTDSIQLDFVVNNSTQEFIFLSHPELNKQTATNDKKVLKIEEVTADSVNEIITQFIQPLIETRLNWF